MKVKTRGLAKSIMAVGVVCIIFYTLLALWRPSTFNVGTGNLLFYASVITLPLGFILLLTSEMKRRRQ
jgi:hypothetical protein